MFLSQKCIFTVKIFSQFKFIWQVLSASHNAMLFTAILFDDPYKNLKLFCPDASERSTLAHLNKISFSLSHKPVLSVTTVTISVLSLTSMPLSAVAQSVQGSWCPGSTVLQSSSVNWNGSICRWRDSGSNLSSPSTNRSMTQLNRK